MATEPLGYLLGSGSRPMPVGKGDVITFGRDPQNAVPVDDATVSRNHACIDCQGDAVLVKDLGSRNGTFVNNRLLGAAELLPLRGGDEIRVGGKVFHFISTAAGLEPRKAALSRAQQFTSMPTLGWDSAYSAVNGKVVAQPTAAPQVPVPAPVEQTHTVLGGADLTAALAGSLSEGSLPQIMQFIHAGGMSGRLYVKSQRVQASILFLNGQLHSATTFDESGAAAVYACALEREGRFAFDRLANTQIEQVPRNITDGTMQVIFECCRRMDESAG